MNAATAGGFGAILLWSTTVAIARSLSEQVGALPAAASVYSVAGTMSLARLLYRADYRRQIGQLPRRYLFGCGTLFVSYMLLLFLAIGTAHDRQQVLEVGLLNYLWPVLTLLLTAVMLRKSLPFMLWLGTALALAGTFLVLTDESRFSWQAAATHVLSNPAAYAMGLVAAVCWAAYSVLTRRWAGDRATGAIDAFLPATAVILLLICVATARTGSWTTRAAIEAGLLGGATYTAYALWDRAMRAGNLLLVVAGSYLTPLLSTIVSCAYLAVLPGPTLWLGCGALIIGSLLSWHAVSDSN